ncbi:MAG: hypothetical protein FWD17_03850, partial [Polyangiaceae bacterium]|nr:hypothetical protein [Polyangiaceae bacterium]
MMRFLSFGVPFALAMAACNTQVPLGDLPSNDGGGGGSQSGQSTSSNPSNPQCGWPAPLADGGACEVNRAWVQCQYPVGVTCEGGASATGASGSGDGSVTTGLTQLCLSSDPTSCDGCTSISGTATCTDLCAPDEYAVSCGSVGPGPGGGVPVPGTQTQGTPTLPAGCHSAGPPTPGGVGGYCCPCQDSQGEPGNTGYFEGGSSGSGMATEPADGPADSSIPDA